MEQRERKPLRLPRWDYGSAGYYFVTVCTQGKAHLFWEREQQEGSETPFVGADIIRPGFPKLTPSGEIVDEAIREIPNHYPGVCVDKYVVMPNHIHAIIRLEGGGGAGGRMISAPTKTLSTVIGSMKCAASRRAGRLLWQKSFYDHIIRNEADYLRIWEYIDTNPAKWTEDIYYCP